ncbi:MAG TPA: hypothetical protein DDX07_13790 [Porphyromonadaceae bacterium]|jgi:tetratricopeptide (TPR) repeat protein|nr:hypothetical protein [Porphyromonadaceae bacterium]
MKTYSQKNDMRILLSITLFIISFIFPEYGYGQEPEVKKLIQEGVTLHDQGEYMQAIDKYNAALKLQPNCAQATYEIALSYLALKDFQKALEFSTAVINTNDKQLSPGAYAVKSEALVEMGQVDDALALLQEGLIRYGDEYLLHFNMAVNYYNKGDVDNTLKHIKKAIDLDKSHSGAFLLYAYALNDKGLWVQSILSMQMFLLLEPDSKRSKNAFEEMLQTMRIKKTGKPVERSFIQQQMLRNEAGTLLHPEEIPPLSTADGLNRILVYQAITSTLDSLQSTPAEEDEFMQFKLVNRAIMKVLQKESLSTSRHGIFWTFYVPFFSHIELSNYYDTFCRYISVSYYPESLEWWQQNTEAAENFVLWFENGDNI